MEIACNGSDENVISPPVGVYKRCSSAASVDFPLPEAPTIAMHSPAEMVREMQRRMGTCGCVG